MNRDYAGLVVPVFLSGLGILRRLVSFTRTRLAFQGIPAGVLGCITQFGFNAQKLVVLGYAV